MKIIVCIKQVPARDAVLKVNAKTRQVDEAELIYEMNGPDTYALEEALEQRDKAGGEVIAMSAGPDRAAQTIREALAKGADRGIHVLMPEGKYFEPFSLATALAKAAKSEAADLILTGLQSEDACYGQTGVIMAELLGCAHASIVTEVQPLESAVRVRRELEAGWSQYLTLPLPAVLTIQSGTNKPRLATLAGIKQAKSKAMQTITSGTLGVAASDTYVSERVYFPARPKSGEIFTGEARACARQLVERLRREARVL